MNLRQLQSDPAAFRAALLIDADGDLRRFGECLDPWQEQDFRALDPAWRRVVGSGVENLPPPISRAWLERPRGHSKTLDIAASASWALFASRRPITGIAAAADKDQAGLLRDATARLCSANPWLGKILDVQGARVLNRHTESELRIISSDAPSSYGLTPDFIVADELVHWQKRDLWDSLLSSAAKRARCFLMVITNAGFIESWQYETREAIRTAPNWFFHRLEGPQASWITADRLAEQRRLLPMIAYRRLWENVWTAGCGDALTGDDIDRAITLTGPTPAPVRGWAYVAGLDLALTRDNAALVTLGVHVGWSEEKIHEPKLTSRQRMMIEAGLVEPPEPEVEYIAEDGSGRVQLAQVTVWRPEGKRISLEAVEQEVLAQDSRFRLGAVNADTWQAAHMVERLQRAGVPARGVDPTPANLKQQAALLLAAFAERSLDLFGDPLLISDLRRLRIEERAYGFRLTSPRDGDGHGDTATALCLALLAAKHSGARPATIEGPLLCWP